MVASYHQEQEQQEPPAEPRPGPVPVPPPTEYVQEQESQQEEFSPEFDAVQERKKRKMPKIYSYADEKTQKYYGAPRARPSLQKVINTEQFTISDMHIQNSSEEKIIGTFALYFIKPGGQVLPLGTEEDKNTKNIWYEVLSGKGLICVQDYTEKVVQCDLILVEPGVKHNFINTGQHPFVIKMLHDFYLDLRDRYTPTAHITKEAEKSREKFMQFNVSTQQVEEKKPQVQPKEQKPTGGESKVQRVPIHSEPQIKTKEATKKPTTNKLKSEERFV